MTEPISDNLLFQLGEFVSAQMGLRFPRERWRDLERGLRSAAPEFGFADAEVCCQWLLSSPLTRSQIETLAGHLTVGETYFFREKRSFEILEEQVLPELIRSRRASERRLRIWSAGCCSGEESYSIAILLSRLIPDWQDWHITILATDINPHFLRKASVGVYGEWSFRETPAWIRERCFKRTSAGRFEIMPSIRKMVTFSYLNLAEDTYPSLLGNTNAMDVIFCRNVLMYFAPEQAKKVVHNLHRSLVDGGWLLVSPAETSQILFSPFVTVNFPSAILYRKESQAHPAVKDFTPGWMPVDFAVPPPPELSVPPVWQESRTPDVEEPLPAQPPPYHEAFVFYEQGRYTEAEERATALLSRDPNDAKAMALLTRIYANQGKLDEALAWCERAVATDRLNPGSHYLQATIQQERGQVEETAKLLKRALYLDPDFVLAHYALGNLALRLGKFEEVDRHFENALALLSAYPRDDLLPESDGLTAGRLMEIIRATVYQETLA
ncbi:MAG: tetratricopeptide repeat protein [Chloroflexi bacterium]|nr:tetratricopeptide repeat protein [Chloroflexota bacterium]